MSAERYTGSNRVLNAAQDEMAAETAVSLTWDNWGDWSNWGNWGNWGDWNNWNNWTNAHPIPVPVPKKKKKGS